MQPRVSRDLNTISTKVTVKMYVKMLYVILLKKSSKFLQLTVNLV